jgi:4-amino-4-deoxy-L-arabinose transferase-like glycosyltransferase
MGADPSIPVRNRIVDQPMGIVAILSLCVLFIAGMRWGTYDEPVRGDQAVYAVIGHELLNGRRLYSGIWDHKPPGIHVTYAVAELVTGYGPQQIYLLETAALVITLLGLYQAGTLLGGTRVGLLAGLLWALGSVFPYWEGYQPNTEVFVNAILVWSYWLIFRPSSAPTWWRACAFGAAVGVASLFKQVAVAPAGLLAIAYVLGTGRENPDRWLRLRHMVVAAVVSIAIWVACVAWFWGRGSLADFYDAVFVYNRSYAGNLMQNLVDSFGPGHKKYLLAVVLPCLLFPYFAGPGWHAFAAPPVLGAPRDPLGPRKHDTQRSTWYGLAAWAIGCHLAIALTGRVNEYYFELWMPVYALAGGGLIAALASGMFEKRIAWGWALLALVVGPLATRFILDVRGEAAPWLIYEPGSWEYWNKHDPRIAALAINRVLLPGERLYGLGPPGQSAPLYFYSRQRPPSGVFYDFPLYPGRPLSRQLEERVVRELDRDPPDLIVLFKDSFVSAFEGKPAAMGQRLVDWISLRYSRRNLDAPTRYVYYARRGSALERRLAEDPSL